MEPGKVPADLPVAATRLLAVTFCWVSCCRASIFRSHVVSAYRSAADLPRPLRTAHSAMSCQEPNAPVFLGGELWHFYDMNAAETNRLIAVIGALVRSRDEFRALAVCGSWARGNPRPDSDLDLLIVVQDPDLFRRDQKWIRELKLSDVGFRYVGHETTKYGVVWSAHIALEPEAELELTLADENWASVRPMDPGTRRVVMDAFKILIDKDGALERLRNACS